MTKFDLIREVKELEFRASRAEKAVSFVTGMLQMMTVTVAEDSSIPDKVKQNITAMLDILYPIYRDSAIRDGDVPYERWDKEKPSGEEEG